MSLRVAAAETTQDDRKLSQPVSDQTRIGLDDESGRESTEIVDFVFLAAQTFGDAELERELLELFVRQARRIVSTLPHLLPHRQADTAHLLKGSARGIGAWAAAEAAAAYEDALPAERPEAYSALADAFAAAEAVIAKKLS